MTLKVTSDSLLLSKYSWAKSINFNRNPLGFIFLFFGLYEIGHLDRVRYRSNRKVWGGERGTGLAKDLEPGIELGSSEAHVAPQYMSVCQAIGNFVRAKALCLKHLQNFYLTSSMMELFLVNQKDTMQCSLNSRTNDS